MIRQVFFITSLLLTKDVSCFSPPGSHGSKRALVAKTELTKDPFADAFRTFAATAIISAAMLIGPDASFADGQTKDFRLPPIDFTDKTRCILNSSKMGQANAARDKL